MEKGLFSRKQPCKNCPYRTDAPMALWSIEEFKLVLDKEADMMGTVFQCHKQDGCVCVGWLIDQDKRRFPSISLRLTLSRHNIDRKYLDALNSPAPLFNDVREMCVANYPELENYTPQ